MKKIINGEEYIKMDEFTADENEVIEHFAKRNTDGTYSAVRLTNGEIDDGGFYEEAEDIFQLADNIYADWPVLADVEVTEYAYYDFDNGGFEIIK